MSTESEDDLSPDTEPEEEQEDIPMMQWLYNRIFLLAILSLVFFFVVYLGWGLLDIISVPTR